MEENWASSIMVVLDKIIKLIYVNLLWFIFTILGLGVFGLMPATAAVFSLTRKIMNNQEIDRVFNEFWQLYKGSFMSSNLAGLIFYTIGLLLYIDFRIVLNFEGTVGKVFLALLFILAIVYFTILINFFPLYTRFEMKIFHYLKLALAIGFGTPIMTLLMLLWLFVVLVLCIRFTVLIPLLSVTLLCIGINWLSMKTVEKKQLLKK